MWALAEALERNELDVSRSLPAEEVRSSGAGGRSAGISQAARSDSCWHAAVVHHKERADAGGRAAVLQSACARGTRALAAVRASARWPDGTVLARVSVLALLVVFAGWQFFYHIVGSCWLPPFTGVVSPYGGTHTQS